MKLLGIDYGLNNLGFATAETPFATPHSVARINSLPEAVATTQKVIESIKPDLVVVGIPEGEVAHSVKNFVTLLGSQLSLKIITHKETLSSKEAISKLRQIKASRAKLKNDHAYAACLILEDYLDLHPEVVKL